MGQNQTIPFQENKDGISSYKIIRQDPEQMITYLTHIKSNEEVILKECTFS